MKTSRHSITILTLGTKILFAIAVITTLCIGSLVSMNLSSARTIEKTVDEVLATREKLSADLRESIVALQNSFIALPDFFAAGRDDEIVQLIENGYPVREKLRLEGRAAYRSFYSRKERRDLSKGGTVIQAGDRELAVSCGIVDDKGNFSETVVRMILEVDDPRAAADDIARLIGNIEAKENSERTLARKVAALGDLVADVGLEAERSRTERIHHIEDISAKEQMLEGIRKQQRDFTIYMGILAVAANLLILFILIRLVIERPLGRLTRSIDAIHRGDFQEIPLEKRRDQIGVLSEAVRTFRQALLDIRGESEQKHKEKQVIDRTVSRSSSMIETIEAKARELVILSERLQTDAETTGELAGKVSGSAEQTAAHTAQVTDSATELEEVMKALDHRIGSQRELVEDVVEKNGLSRTHMQELAQAVGDIDSIIALVHKITEQSRLLALNATIEAARAGEYGKGFSIVAAEMKELSDSTATAASQVRSRVAAINDAGSTLKVNFDEIGERLGLLADVTEGIAADVAAQQPTVGAISSLAVKTSANTREVSASIRQVTEAACETSLHARNVHQCADAIAEQLALLSVTTATLTRLRAQDEASPGEAATEALGNFRLTQTEPAGAPDLLEAA